MEARTLKAGGFEVSVICPKGQYPRYFETIEDIHIYRYPLPSLNGVLGHALEYFLALFFTFILSWIVLIRDGFDAIQSANPPDLFFVIAVCFKWGGKKFVFDHHDLVPETCLTRWRGRTLQLMYHFSLWVEKKTFHTADRVISTNESYRRIAIQRGRMRPEHVYVVRSGPSLSKFLPIPPNPTMRNGCRFLVSYLGVMGPNDGIEILLQSIRHIVRQLGRTDIRFILIGAGDEYQTLVDLSRELALENQVHFTGRIPDQEVIEIICSSDVCVAPDPKDPLNDLSTMNKIIEYMALGKPIVAFDLQEARVSADKAAYYAAANNPVDFAEKILLLLEEPEKRQSMGAFGRQRFLERLAWEHQSRQLLALYEELLMGPQINESV